MQRLQNSKDYPKGDKWSVCWLKIMIIYLNDERIPNFSEVGMNCIKIKKIGRIYKSAKHLALISSNSS